jgi:hypothetical protein
VRYAMNSSSANRVLSRSTSALVAPYDVTDLLARLTEDSARVVGADSAGLLLTADDNELELLSATSHRAAELEIYQLQVGEGPCQDSVHRAEQVRCTSTTEMLERWPTFGRTAVAAGYRSAHAAPMLWHGRAIGGINYFFSDERGLDDEYSALAQAFADVATIAIVHSGGLSPTELVQATKAALRGRTAIEQAKGVLAYEKAVDMSTAYHLLRDEARKRRTTLTQVAEDVIRQAQSRRQ